MRRFAIAFAALALSIHADDKPDARQEAVDKVASMAALLDKGGDDVFKLMDEVKTLSDAFGEKYAPTGGAAAIASTEGGLVFLAGGTRARDGVGIVVAQAPKGRKMQLRGGNGGKNGRAGRSAAWADGGISASGANGGGTGGGRGGSFSVASGGSSASGSTGRNGDDAEKGGTDDLADAKEIASLVEAVEALGGIWDDKEKRQASVNELSKHRPSQGAVAAYSADGKLLVLIGANGSDRNPDGISVEVSGKAADRIVAIAGNAGANGKPGTAKAPEGGVTVNGK